MTDNLHEMDEATLLAKTAFCTHRRDHAPTPEIAARWNQLLIEIAEERDRRKAAKAEEDRLIREAFDHGSWFGMVDDGDPEWSNLIEMDDED